MRQETVGKHVLHADSIIFGLADYKVFHIRLKVTGAKATFTYGSNTGPLQGELLQTLHLVSNRASFLDKIKFWRILLLHLQVRISPPRTSVSLQSLLTPYLPNFTFKDGQTHENSCGFF